MTIFRCLPSNDTLSPTVIVFVISIESSCLRRLTSRTTFSKSAPSISPIVKRHSRFRFDAAESSMKSKFCSRQDFRKMVTKNVCWVMVYKSVYNSEDRRSIPNRHAMSTDKTLGFGSWIKGSRKVRTFSTPDAFHSGSGDALVLVRGATVSFQRGKRVPHGVGIDHCEQNIVVSSYAIGPGDIMSRHGA